MLNSPSSGSWQKVSPVEVLITRACDPSHHEPNYALHLEVAEHINQKKANTPREAALLLARLGNHRNPHISILALALLDTLSQSCGYPFHLQISTKEFLNELVRRFPERPPAFPGPVMSRILELINSWKEGICTESRWKEDLGNIRDMHRLLIFKGYRFRTDPSSSRRAAENQLATAANLKSADELENEDREAQSAKLQELIRRGTPRDLAAAQELMKSLAGAVPEGAKPDYRSQALTDLNKLEQKVILLNEMLDNVDVTQQEKLVSGDAYEQVATILTSARPKIQKWIEEAQEGSDDSESLDTFLQINDQINTVLSRYDSFKKGDYSAAANPVPSQYGNGNSAGGGISLIDFDDQSGSGDAASSATNDLDGLFGGMGSTTPAQQQQHQAMNMGMIGVFSMPQQQQPQQQQQQPQQLQPQPQQPQRNSGYGMAMLLGETSSYTRPSSTGSGSRTGTPQQQQGGIRLPGTPVTGGLQQQQPQGTGSPNYFSNGGLGGSGMGNVGSGLGMGGMGAPSPQMQMGGNMGMGIMPQQQQPQMGMGSPASPMGTGGMNNNMGIGMGGSIPNNGMGTGTIQPQPNPQQQVQGQQQQQPVAQGGKSNDPFGDLAGLF